MKKRVQFINPVMMMMIANARKKNRMKKGVAIKKQLLLIIQTKFQVIISVEILPFPPSSCRYSCYQSAQPIQQIFVYPSHTAFEILIRHRMIYVCPFNLSKYDFMFNQLGTGPALPVFIILNIIKSRMNRPLKANLSVLSAPKDVFPEK